MAIVRRDVRERRPSLMKGGRSFGMNVARRCLSSNNATGGRFNEGDGPVWRKGSDL